MYVLDHYILKKCWETEQNPKESDSDIMIKVLKSLNKKRLKELAFSLERSKMVTMLKYMNFFWCDAVVDWKKH